ncbi:MAG TPA: C1 family peptidase [bacterium]|nr:C1 family peptidase [bacterium]
MKSAIFTVLLLTVSMLMSGTACAGIPDAESVQAAVDAAGACWIACHGPFDHWTPAELEQLTGGILPDPDTAPVADPISLWAQHAARGTLPETHDWRDVAGVDWMTPVKNQGNCGACAAFASVGCVEAVIRIAGNQPDLPVDLSEQHLFSCCNGDCPTGLYMGDAFNYFRDYGVPDEACLPYSAVDDNCEMSCSDWQDRAEQIRRWDLLWQYNVDEEVLKGMVMDQPVACYMEVFGDFMQYKSGIYEHVTGNLMGGHFVVIIGWNDADDCWICKNSWGTGWGEKGYFRIRRGETSIGTWAMVPEYESTAVTPTPRPTATPTPVLELGVTLAMPRTTYSPGDTFYLDVVLGNPGVTIPDVPVCVLLEAGGQFFCWPGWTPLSEQFDCCFLDIPLGRSTLHVISPFSWPQIPPADMEFVFWGALLNPEMNGILGHTDCLAWGY